MASRRKRLFFFATSQYFYACKKCAQDNVSDVEVAEADDDD